MQWQSAISWYMQYLETHVQVATPQFLKDFEARMRQGRGKDVAANETPKGFKRRLENLSQLSK